MAEQIKSFFQKKVADKKFKHAGKGHKLNEPTPSASTSSKITEIPKRHEPTDDAKVAGQAALARIDGKKTNTPKFNTSYAAIQARVKRELQQEKLALANQTADDNVESTNKTIKTDQLDVKPQEPAVRGVYYRCPLVSEEILDKETWYKKIQEFFSTQLLDDEAGLSACLIIHSCNGGLERINYCVETLCKYLHNIINDPTEKKYWKIRMSNKIFQEKIRLLNGSMEFLKAAGFIQEKLMHQDKEEEFLVWSPERSSLDNLRTLIDALNSAESVQFILDRNVQVLLPSQAAERTELPAQFYVFSMEDLKHELGDRKKCVEQNQMLMTAAMREKFMKKTEKNYRFTLIRIRFPDSIILQGTFEVTENFQAVIDFVKEHLSNQEFSFHLITATRQMLTEADFQKTLETLDLIPAVVLTFFWNNNSNSKPPSQYLKDETLNLLQSL